MEYKAGDKIRIKEGVSDPDVPDWDISGMPGTVVGSTENYVEVILNVEYPQWVIEELKEEGQDYKDACSFGISEVELRTDAHSEYSKPMQQKQVNDVEKAVEIIKNLIKAINVLPCAWDEFVGLEFAHDVAQFLAKHDDYWKEILDEMDGVE